MSFRLGRVAAEQIARLIPAVKSMLPGHLQRAVLPSRIPIWRGFKPTSGPSGVVYTGDLITFDGTTETTLATGVKGVSANGETLTLNTRYTATLIGENSGQPLYMAFRTGGCDVKEEGGTTINATLMELENEDFDVTTPSGPTLPFVRTQGNSTARFVGKTFSCSSGTATLTTDTWTLRRGLVSAVAAGTTFTEPCCTDCCVQPTDPCTAATTLNATISNVTDCASMDGMTFTMSRSSPDAQTYQWDGSDTFSDGGDTYTFELRLTWDRCAATCSDGPAYSTSVHIRGPSPDTGLAAQTQTIVSTSCDCTGDVLVVSDDHDLSCLESWGNRHSPCNGSVACAVTAGNIIGRITVDITE